MYKSGLIVTFLACVGTSFALCPNFTPTPNFDPASFAGQWRLHHFIGNWASNTDNFQCLHLNISSQDWRMTQSISARIIGHGQSTTGGSYDEDYIVTIPDVNDPARWSWNLIVLGVGIPGTSAILHADNDYALMGNCIDFLGLNYVYINFLSRSFDPMPQSVIDNFRTMAESYAVPDTTFYKVEQSFRICASHAFN